MQNTKLNLKDKNNHQKIYQYIYTFKYINTYEKPQIK